MSKNIFKNNNKIKWPQSGPWGGHKTFDINSASNLYRKWGVIFSIASFRNLLKHNFWNTYNECWSRQRKEQIEFAESS